MKLKELRTRKYVALIMMIVIIGAIVGILKIGNMDFDKGKVKVSKAVINNVTSSLSANVNEATVDNLITSKGYDEIDYVIKYSLSTDENIKERNVIIEASLDDNEKYASFKDITNGDVISTVFENRKNIKITVKNAKVNKENELKLVMKLEGASNGYKVTPKIKIKEVSEEKYTNLNVQNVEVKNNSLTGNVQDEQSMNVSNIELALKKDGETIKKTYTDEDGNYVFSDIDEGEYNLEIDEDIYEKVSEEKVNISGSSKLNIVVKEVTPYKIELKKQITEMTIVNGNKTTTYKYGNLDKVQQALRNVKNMTGEVKYKITVQNTGKKSGVVTVVKDEVPEGLTFNKEKNTSWEEKNGVLYNRSLEGITLNAGEKREEGLTLDIESTSEAKTYINKVTAKGEIYENIVYILDGKTYKEDTALEGEKIKEPKVDNKDFKGWYTDKKYTNKYNFNNEVTKDLVLYGQTEEIKEYTVTYVDNEKIVKTEKVKENGSLTAPKVSKEGHTFKYWSEEPNGKEYDLNTKVTKDITLYSVYDINKYTVTFINGKEKYDEQQVEYGGNIKVPTSPLKEYYTFKYWSLEENGDSYDLNTKVTKDITLYSVYDINKYTVTFIDKGKEIDKQELEAGSVVIAPKVSMEGYKFKYWSEKENGKEYNLNLPITRNLTLYSVYEINKYNVEFYDSNKLIKTIKVDYDNTINSNEIPTVSKIGYTFTGWTENNKNFDFTTKIKENKKLYSKYEIIKNAVIFNDENRITTKKVDYNNKVEKIESQGKTGYTFKYWSTTQDGEEFDFNTLITESITLYAVYEINEYSVNFIDQGNVYGDTQKVKYNNAAVKPETDPIKEGYTFKYWSLEENGVAYDFNTKITKDTTLYSVYSVNNYKVSFVDNGTKYIEDETIEYNKTAIKPETDPSKVGHTFKYWSLEENGVAYDFNAKITKDITLYSVYSVNNYKVSFIDNGTKYIEDETIEYNKAAIKPETDPSKVGHTFKYWSLGENGTAYDFSTKITKDTTLYSVYEANEYTVKFMDGDNLFKQEQVKYGLKATKPSENPTKEHNLFKTWTLNDKEYDFNLPVIDNMILRSSYEEIEKPSISHVPTEWTNNKVTVTITSSHEDYKYLYKIDTGEYKEYTGPFDIDYNCTVVAKSVKENVDSITESHDITNIDKIKPIINSLNETNVSGTSFDINVSTIDNESGMKQIHIYKDDLLETTIVYTENYNEEKNSTYTFNDLISGNDYKIKVIAEDVAGNLSEAKEITVKTEEKIVARIIGRENKLFEDENLCENFSSLERAIKACPSNQCTIEMVTDTKESVEVLEGQDITLNINGKTITGVKDTYTINNGGNLIIKDSTEEAGSIVNSTGVALKNEATGVLTLGELEEELVVSTTKPYINGGTFGVVNEYIDKNTKGRFNFYDGMIAGNIAIEGEVNDKPYLYNASVVTSDNRQVATLKILEDAEARIVRTGVYYTKVNEAIEDTNKGTTEEAKTKTTLIEGFKSKISSGFTYDSETNTLSSGDGKVSMSYTTIDLTGYEKNQYLYISGYKTNETSTSTILVKEQDENGNEIVESNNSKVTTTSNKFKYLLSKGKKYYVELKHIPTVGSTIDDKFILTNMYMQPINSIGEGKNVELTTVTSDSNYSFEYDEGTRTLKSNNQYQNGTKSFSYLEVDLTNATENKEVIINASLDTLYNGNYGNIVINEDNSQLSSALSSALAYVSVNGYSSYNSQTYAGPYNYSKELEKGKKYYIQFYYFKSSYDNYSESDYKEHGSKDQFIINTIDIVGKGDKKDIDLNTNLKTNYYGFDNYDSYYNSYSVQNNAPSGEKFDSYVKIDLTKSKVDQMIDLNLKLNNYSSIYITSNNKDSGKDLIINNMNNTLLSFYLNYDYYINGNSHWSSFYDYKYVLPKGSVYYVHFAGYNPGGKSGASIKSISLIPVTDNMINIGTLPHLKGTIDDSNKPADTNLSYVTNDGTKDANFRFVGNNTKNYVKFNNELWRAIGIFNTTDSDGNYAKRIKLIRDKSLYQDLNIYLSWDSSDSSINNGTGINEWSQADLMKLLNEGYENNAPNNIYSEDTKCKKGEKENPDLPKYIVDDTIYFDPVKYRICDSESDSCPAWTVMSGNNCTGEYELVYKKSDVYDYSKAIESNGGSYDNVLINYLNKISETWSDKIISPSPGSNMNSLFDFTKSKARILNSKELSENNLSKKLSICASSYIASSPCSYPILVMSENNYYFLVNKNVLNQNFPFSNANYSLSINPVIKIDLNKVENKSDFIGKEKANTLKLNNSLYWTGKSGHCFIGSGEYNKQCDFSNIGLSNSAKSMIDSVVWNTGALPNDYNTRNNLTALEVYAMERGNNNGKTNMDTTSNSYDTVNRTTSWIGKVGLPYASDYILSAGNGSSYTRDECIKGNSSKYANCVSYNSWLNSTNTDGNSLTITPIYGGEYPSNVASIYTSIYSYPAYSSSTIKPTVYLSPKVKITSGSGTQDDPFIIELGKEDNTTLYYGLVPDLIKEDVKEEETEINEEPETIDYTYVKKAPLYGFTYDNEKGVFTNENKEIANTTAVSYIKLDLTNASNDMPLSINYSISNSGYSSMGFINLMKNNLIKINYNDSSSYSQNSLVATSRTSYSDTVPTTLEKGNIYYLQFAYKNSGSYTGSGGNVGSFEVSITYTNEEDKTNSYTRYDGITPTLNKESDTVQIIKDITLTNSMNIDIARSMILDLNGHTITTSSNDYVLKNNGDLTIIDSKYWNDVDDAQNAYDNEYKATISKYNKKYDSYTINDYVQDGLEMNLDGIEHGNDSSTWIDSSGKGNNGTINGSASFGKNYLSFDGVDDYVDLGKQNYEKMTIETVISNFSGTYKTILYNKYNGGYELRLTSTSRMQLSFYLDSSSSLKSFNSTFSKSTDKIYYAVTFDGEYAKAYLNGVLISSQPFSGKINYVDSDNHLLLGTGKNGDNLKYLYNGNIYSTRIYNKALTEEEIIKNYKIDEKRYSITNQKLTSNTSSLGIVTSESGENPYKLFDGNLETNWSSESQNESYIDYKMSTKKTLLGFKIYGNDISKYPKEVELLGSADGINYNTILLKSLEQKGLNEYNEISISNDECDSYMYYRWKFKNDGNIISIREIELYLNNIVRKKVTTSSLPVSGTISSATNSVIYNGENANLNIEDGIFKLDKSGVYNLITNLGNLKTSKNTKLYANKSNNTAIYNDKTGTLDINSSYLYGYSYGVKNDSFNDIKINVNEISGAYGIYNKNFSNMDINATTITSSNAGIYNIGNGNVIAKIKKLSLSASNAYGLYNGGTGNVDATITTLTTSSNNSYGIYNNSIGNITLKNTNVTYAGNYGIYNKDNGEINLISSKITLTKPTSTSINYGIYNAGNGNINTESTNILISGSINTSYKYYGIYMYNTGKLHLINTSINGYQYGIYSNGDASINMESGTITATNTGIYNEYGQSDIGVLNGSSPKINGTSIGMYTKGGIISLNNGTVSSDDIGIQNSCSKLCSTSKIDINGGTISGKTGIETYAILNINDGVVKGVTNGVYVHSAVFKLLNGTITTSGLKSKGIYIYGGTTEITGGTIKTTGNKSNGIYSHGILNVSNATITTTGDDSNGIYSSGTTNISDAKIIASGYENNGLNLSGGNLNINSGSIEGYRGLYINSGKATITGGEIRANSFGIYSSDNSLATVTLGVKDKVVDTENPKIVSDLSGIYGAGQLYLNYYDGVITGSKNLSLDAIVKDYEEGYDINTHVNKENENLTDMILVKTILENFGEVAEVDGIKYPSVKLAVDSISDSGTDIKEIKLLKNVETIVNIGELNKNISINTNDKNIRYIGEKTYITNRNNLKIYTESKNIIGITTNYATIIDNYGTLVTESDSRGYLYVSNTKNNYVMINNAGSTANINSGMSGYLESIKGYYKSIMNNGKLTLKNSDISGEIDNENGTITSEGSNIESNSTYGIYNINGIINISNTSINNSGTNGVSLYNKEGNVTSINSTISSTGSKSKGVYNSGTFIMESGEMKGILNGMDNNGTFTLNDGTISLSNSSVNGDVIETNNVVNLYGGLITTANSKNATSILASSDSTVNIYGGSIQSLGTNNTAIYINAGSSVNLGTKGDVDNDGNLIVSTNNPTIKSSTIGISVRRNSSKNGIFNFYDGIVIAPTAIDGAINEIEDGYNVKTDTDENNNEVKYLERSFVVKNLTTNEKFYSLNEAVENASNDDTLQFIQSINLLPEEKTTEIIQGKTITIDINGKVIDSTNTLFIKNEGQLKIIDSANTLNEDKSVNYGNGKLSTTGSSIIENIGTLEIDSVVIAGNHNTGNIISNNDSGNLVIKNSKFDINLSSIITSGKDNFNGISNLSNGDVTISNTEFYNSTTDSKVTGYSIYNGIGSIILENNKFYEDSDSGVSAIYNDNDAEIKVKNSTILRSIYNNSSKDINLENCIFKHVNNGSTGNINITGGSVNVENLDTYPAYIPLISNYGTGDINVDNLSVSTKGSKIASFYNASSGNININSGDIINSSNSVKNIYNKSSGTINIGKSSNEKASNDMIKINSGIYNEADGIINIYYANIDKTQLQNISSGTINIGENSNEKASNDLINVPSDSSFTLTNASGIINVYYGTLINTEISNNGGLINIYGGNITSKEDINCIFNKSGTLHLYGGNITLNKTKDSYSNSIRNDDIANIKNATINGSILNNGKMNVSSSSIMAPLANYDELTMISGKISHIANYGTSNIKGGTVESNASGIYNEGVINIGTKGDKDESENIIVSKDQPIIKGKTYGILLSSTTSNSINFYDGKIIGKKSFYYDRDTDNENPEEIYYNINDIEDDYSIVTTTDEDGNEISSLEKVYSVRNLTTNTDYYNLQNAIDEAASGDTIQFIRNVKYLKNQDTLVVNSRKNIIIDINGKSIDSYNSVFIDNKGTLTITDSSENGEIVNHSSTYISKLINNTGNLEIKNTNLSSDYVRGGVYAIYNSKGTLKINNGTISSTGTAIGNDDYGTITINGTNIIGRTGISNSCYEGIININDVNIEANNIGISNSSTAITNFNSGTINVTSTDGYGIYVNGGGGTINVKDGTIISTKYAVYNHSSVATINIGEKDGIVSITSPSLYGKDYAVVNEGIFNLYDGKLTGDTAPVSGTITDVEPGYKLSINDDKVNNTKVGCLVVIGEDERVAMVNGINFTSLQTAINSVKDKTESNIVIYKDIELTEDIIVPENKIINLYLNGHTITYGDYSFVKNGTLTIIDSAPSESIGASIINIIEKVLNINQNGKNIIVYEMSDGSKLSTENTYNLYKKEDNEYKLLNMEKDEEVGRYITGSNNSEMTSIKGRIYLNNLEEGSYKLVSSDNKDIEFTITEDGKLNGNILENTNEKRKVIETAFAYLIITIQTGVNQIKYIIYIVAIVSIILGLYFAFKEQKKLSRKV